MKINLSIGSKAALGLSVLSILASPSILRAANLEGTWIQHPAAQLRSPDKFGQINRIIEGNRYVYFSVGSAHLNRNELYTTTTTLEKSPVQVFIYDKNTSWGEPNSIRALAREFSLSGNFPGVMEYSPSAGVFAVIHENNSMDFIYDDGTVVNSKALSDASVPQDPAIPFSICFDEEKPVVYVAGTFGYAAVNRLTGETENVVRTDKAVSWASRLGENMVVFAGDVTPNTFKYNPSYGVIIPPTQTYATETYLVPLTVKGTYNFAGKTPVEGTERNLQALMVLSDSSFAAIAPGTSDTSNRSLNLFTLSEGKAVSSVLVSGLNSDDSASISFRHLFHSDGLCQKGKEGYVVQSQNHVILLGNDGKVSLLPKEGLTANEKASKAGSLDGNSLWLFTYESNGLTDNNPRGFYSYELQNDIWTGKTEPNAPNAPVNSFSTRGEWNTKYGLLVRSGSLINEQEVDCDNLSGYKDGQWTDFSYGARNSTYVAPTRSADYVTTDPLNPDWVWGRSNRAGLHRVDLGNHENFLGFGSNNYTGYQTACPGYFPLFKLQDANRAKIMFTNVDFDTDDTMWFARYVYTNDGAEGFGSVDILNAKIPFYYLTAEERKAIAAIGDDQSRLPNFIDRGLEVPHTVMGDNGIIRALKSPKNKNYLAFSHVFYENYYTHAALYDHNGTLDNKEDDRHIFLTELFDEKGDRVTFAYHTGLYEDSNTGELWMLTSSGPFILDPSDILDGKKTCRRPKITRKDGINVEENPFEFVIINNITDDFLGRKWMATDQGLYCISADAEEILGRYWVENSPIPSNEVYDVVCSPEGVVFALTSRGIAEFHPEGNIAAVPASQSLNIWPTAVTPDYNGYVTVTGAEGGSEYFVYDAEGNPVTSLGQPDGSNSLQWDCRNDDGKRLPAGRYNIKRSNVEEENIVIIL